MNLKNALTKYLADLEDRQCSRSHIDSVAVRLGRFVAGHEHFPLEEITGGDVADHFGDLAAAGLAHGTLAGYKATHKAFWKWCQAQGWVGENPARVLSRREHSYSYRPVNHQPADRDAFQTVVDALPAFVARDNFARRDVRDALIVSLAIDSSARRGSLWQIRRADAERALERGQPAGSGRMVYRVMVSGKTGATPVRFFDETAALARRWLGVMPSNAVWLFCSLRSGRKLRRDYMGSAFARVCAFAGVPRFSFQAVRKRVVMDVIAGSGDAKVGQLLAGHADERTTAAYYNLVQEEAVAAAAANLASERRGRPVADGEALAAMLFKRE